ncbi:hypothetical protein LCGC14_2864460 [marine sediment metagenome]|uniref:Uncharacterized protein n=1 Tax=marine sediment metagenome TaxID=412755 RepID=A0A0F8Y533_9ZZZZ
MTIAKRRGRKPGKKAFAKQVEARANQHWLDCQECGLESREVDGDVTAFTCWKCVSAAVPWPVAKQPETAEEKTARLERKAARLAKKEAIAAGTFVEPVKPGSLGFGRGWHRCVIFSHLGEDGKQVYYSRGKKITKVQFTKLVREHAKKHAPKPTSEFGRGWHFRKVFVAPNGDIYNLGKLAEKAAKQPNFAEFQALMEQHLA